MKIDFLIAYMALILTTSLIPMDGNIQGLRSMVDLKPTIQNLLHIPAYGILTVLGLGLAGVDETNRLKKITLVLLLVIGFGILNEAVQMRVLGRYAGVMDLGLNTVGVLIGFLFYVTLQRIRSIR